MGKYQRWGYFKVAFASVGGTIGSGFYPAPAHDEGSWYLPLTRSSIFYISYRCHTDRDRFVLTCLVWYAPGHG